MGNIAGQQENRERAEKSHLIQSVESELVQGDDGYVRFFTRKAGYISAGQLRLIADEISKRNAEWDKLVHNISPNKKLYQAVWVNKDSSKSDMIGQTDEQDPKKRAEWARELSHRHIANKPPGWRIAIVNQDSPLFWLARGEQS